MTISYTKISGQSIERLCALSDGVFAIALTLLVLDLHVPASALIHSEAELWRAMLHLAPHLAAYFLSFMTLGIFWMAQQSQLNSFASSDRRLTWIHLGFLLAVCVMPFSTAMLAGFLTQRLSIAIYWFNLFWLGLMLFASVRYAVRAELIKGDARALQGAHERRILWYQLLYAAAALVCFANIYVSMALLILLQLHSILGLPTGWGRSSRASR